MKTSGKPIYYYKNGFFLWIATLVLRRVDCRTAANKEYLIEARAQVLQLRKVFR